MRRFYEVVPKDKIWRELFPLFGHATSYLTQMARQGRSPAQAYDGSPFEAPARGFFLKDYMPEREALYREGGEAAVALLMGFYGAAAGAGEQAAHWMRLATEESRRVGASFIQVASGADGVATMLSGGLFEEAVETGIFVGRGMVAQRAVASEDRSNFEGVGVDLLAEFRKLPEDQRRLGDRFSLLSGVLPAAMALVQLSLAEPTVAAGAGQRLVAIFRDLAADEFGDSEMWRTVAQLFELTSVESTSARHVVTPIQSIEGKDERAIALKVLGNLLATWHASPEEAIRFQLSIIEVLFRWFPAGEPIRRCVLTPYVEAYWRHTSRERRFAFRAPALTVASIEAASAAPEPERICAVLSAAGNGLLVRGAQEVLQRLRAAST
jgi:hypothetical protein